jgi:nuclear transcription factor Y gamma
LSQVSQGLTGQAQDILNVYWQNQVTKLESETHDFKMHQLPLARIKKVMKADPEVKMISAEAPILFAKGCDIFITELTMRAWIHAEENKRRTLQRSDIASALAKSDMFDFLIDIVPRDEAQQGGKKGGHHGNAAHQAAAAAQMGAHGAVQGNIPHPHMAPSEYQLEPHMQPGGPYMPVQQVPQPLQQADATGGAYTGHPQEMNQQFIYGNYQMQPQVRI